MNPIEHVWDYLKRQIRDREARPTTLRDLKEAVIDEWDRMPQDFVDDLVRSMPRRIETLARARGGNTRKFIGNN